MYYKQIFYLCSFFYLFFIPFLVHAEDSTEEKLAQERLALYKKTEALSLIPWYYIAAIDQYERNIQTDIDPSSLISIHVPDEKWYGLGNISKHSSANVISLFDGIGLDGNADGLADSTNPEDILYSFSQYLASYGTTKEDIKIALFDYYQRDLTVQAITQTAEVFKKFQDIELTDRTFPLPTTHNYTYQSTWGAGRGFGGVRIHEGTDIFASYGTPVQSTTYGVIELKGWNLFGGWRLGIRDTHNIYHYYAHLNSYHEGIEVGSIVKPGDILGSVGSSGYGPPGTAGKFPAHLHYGMYKDNGHSEWSFDPYPYLRKWESTGKSK